jgi:AraC-like DNA-binding protein
VPSKRPTVLPGTLSTEVIDLDMRCPQTSASNDRHTLGGLAEIASRWGYGYEILSVDDHVPRPAHDLSLAEGVITTVESGSGIRICASDLVTVGNSERVGLLPRSLTIILLLDGDAADYSLDAQDRMVLAPGNGLVVAVAQAARLRQFCGAGRRSRSVVVQACPADLADAELAQQIDRTLRTNAAVPLLTTFRVHALANDLFAPRHVGAVGRLLAESCALELLATGLGAVEQMHGPAGGTLNARDMAKILRVRDKLMSELEQEHCLSDLARVAGVSVSALNYKFQAVVGQSVFSFLRDQRLERARQGLQHDGWTVGQAAYFAGYRHSTNFATAFRKKFGVSPNGLPRR